MNTTSALMLDILNNSTEVHGIDAISRQITGFNYDQHKYFKFMFDQMRVAVLSIHIYILPQLINCTKLTKLDLSGTFGLR